MKNLLAIIALLVIIGCCPSCKGGPATETWLIVGQSNVDTGTVAFKFARAMSEAGRPVALLNAAEGGTSIACWREGGECYSSYLAPYLGFQIHGILYWQGETDALGLDGDSWQNYGDTFIRLIQEYRSVFGEVPFIFVELPRHDPNISASESASGLPFDEPSEWQVCREGQRAALELDDVEIVETSDITFGEIHPSYAYAEIGERAAEIALGRF